MTTRSEEAGLGTRQGCQSLPHTKRVGWSHASPMHMHAFSQRRPSRRILPCWLGFGAPCDLRIARESPKQRPASCFSSLLHSTWTTPLPPQRIPRHKCPQSMPFRLEWTLLVHCLAAQRSCLCCLAPPKTAYRLTTQVKEAPGQRHHITLHTTPTTPHRQRLDHCAARRGRQPQQGAAPAVTPCCLPALRT